MTSKLSKLSVTLLVNIRIKQFLAVKFCFKQMLRFYPIFMILYSLPSSTKPQAISCCQIYFIVYVVADTNSHNFRESKKPVR